MILVRIVLRCVVLGHVQSLKVDKLVCRQVKGSYSLTDEIAVSFTYVKADCYTLLYFKPSLVG